MICDELHALSGEDTHEAGELPRHGSVGAVAQLQVAVDDVRVLEHAGEACGCLEEDPRPLT
jgi:hypothetical protein